MNRKSDSFVVESTPVLDLKKSGLENHSEPGMAPAHSWDADRTEVYADIEDSDAVASLVADTGESYPITTFPFVIGRGTECDLVMQGKGVSRKHAEIVFQSGRFVVNDIESLNGIKVNGYKVARVILEEKDVIKLGEVSLTFYSGDGKPQQTVVQPEEKKKGLFAKRDDVRVEKDDTFGPSPIKKLVSMSVITVSIAVIAYTGFVYFQNGEGTPALGDPGQQSVSTPVPPKPVSAPVATVATLPVAQQASAVAVRGPAENVSTQESAPPPKVSSIAPPPSLAMAPKPIESKPISTKVAPSPAPATSKAVPKPAPSLNAQAASAQATAIGLYAQGKAPQALSELNQYIGNAAVSKSYQDNVKSIHSEIAGLYSQYTEAQKAYSAGDKDLAFSSWTSFMSKEAVLLKGQKSAYSRSIVTKVMDEYVERGNLAFSQEDYHGAYNNWTKAVELGDSVSAKIAMDNLNNKAQQLYRQALRLEYVNTNKSKAMWTEVTKLLPPGTEYHTKASAKLAWYEKWGS